MDPRAGTIERAILDALLATGSVEVPSLGFHASAAQSLAKRNLVTVEDMGDVLRVSLTATGTDTAIREAPSPESEAK